MSKAPGLPISRCAAVSASDAFRRGSSPLTFRTFQSRLVGAPLRTNATHAGTLKEGPDTIEIESAFWADRWTHGQFAEWLVLFRTEENSARQNEGKDTVAAEVVVNRETSKDRRQLECTGLPAAPLFEQAVVEGRRATRTWYAGSAMSLRASHGGFPTTRSTGSVAITWGRTAFDSTKDQIVSRPSPTSLRGE